MLEAIGIVVAIVTGVAGMVVSLLTYINQRDTSRPRIRVRPRVLSLVDRGAKTTEDNVGVMEVCNVGSVPVIGSTVGFLARRKGEKGTLIVTPESINGLPWSGELKPGQVTMLRMKLDGLTDPDSLGLAFAATLVGDTFTCTRKDMKKFREDVMAVRKRSQGGAESRQ